MFKLLQVPQDQKDWFNFEFEVITSQKCYKSQHRHLLYAIDLRILKRNIFGNNDRLHDYSGPENTVYESFWIDLIKGGPQEEAAIFILTMLKEAIEEAVKLEHYEIAENIKNITQGIETFVSAYNKYSGEILTHKIKDCKKNFNGF